MAFSPPNEKKRRFDQERAEASAKAIWEAGKAQAQKREAERRRIAEEIRACYRQAPTTMDDGTIARGYSPPQIRRAGQMIAAGAYCTAVTAGEIEYTRIGRSNCKRAKVKGNLYLCRVISQVAERAA